MVRCLSVQIWNLLITLCCTFYVTTLSADSDSIVGQTSKIEDDETFEISSYRSNLPVRIADKGIFSDLNSRISVALFPPSEKSHLSILVDKKHRTLSILYDGVPQKSYPIALGFTPVGAKKVEGDGKTPEGTYYISEKRHRNLPAKYGARSMLLSYPSVKDAKRGLKANQIPKQTYAAIQDAISKYQTPPQDTVLGSAIRIHGGGIHSDWTAGCIAMRDEDAKELYSVVKEGTPVLIQKEAPVTDDLDNDGIPNQNDVLLGALKTDINNASYDASYQILEYPGGDVARTKGCCADVVVRALRNAGLDLQQAIQNDIQKRPGAYPGITTPNRNIDHRRARNMLIYMKKHFQTISEKQRKEAPLPWMPGDIVLFDTLPKKGPDHIGIVSSTVSENGTPLIINNWTVGSTTDEMDLLSWVPVTHHFRMK